MSDLTTGLKNRTGKGRRLILLHIGSDSGVLEGGELIIVSKQTVDYHERMKGEVFVNWMHNILPRLASNSVIVIDNAPYHSVELQHIPTKQWRKQNIEWMYTKGIAQFKLCVILLIAVKRAVLGDQAMTIDKQAKHVAQKIALEFSNPRSRRSNT